MKELGLAFVKEGPHVGEAKKEFFVSWTDSAQVSCCSWQSHLLGILKKANQAL